MSKKFNMSKGVVMALGMILVIGMTGCSSKQLCLHPECDNEAIEGTGACYKHGSNAKKNSYKGSGSSYSNSTYMSTSSSSSTSKSSSSSGTGKSSLSSSGSKKSGTTKYKTYGVEDYDNPDDLVVNTIQDVIYLGMKNDVSFLFDSKMNLFEHQSTWNPNMPLRGLFYFSINFCAAVKIAIFPLSYVSDPWKNAVYGGRTGPSALSSMDEPCVNVPAAIITSS